MRKLRYVGTADKVDMRPVVGRAGDDSPTGLKFVFYARTSKTNRKEGERQHAEGVEVSDKDAMEILTSPHRVWGFEDITDAEHPVLEGDGPQGTPETGYPVEPLVPAEATADTPKGSQKPKPPKTGEGEGA